jgi:hypothetical protein
MRARRARAIIAGMMSLLPNPICGVVKLVVDLVLGPEEQVAYVSVTTR